MSAIPSLYTMPFVVDHSLPPYGFQDESAEIQASNPQPNGPLGILNPPIVEEEEEP